MASALFVFSKSHSRVVRHNLVTAHNWGNSDGGASENKKLWNIAHPVRLYAVAPHVLEIDIRTILQNDNPEVVPTSFRSFRHNQKPPALYIEQDIYVA